QKTVVFVTHDIDEAIKMGDRIAILREGGVLAQYDTPQEILTHPADAFVAQFVGADRGLKRLALTTLGELELASPDGAGESGGSNGERRVPREMSVRDGLSLLLSSNGEALTVIDGEGRVQGLLTLAVVEQLLSEEALAAPRTSNGSQAASSPAGGAPAAEGVHPGSGG